MIEINLSTVLAVVLMFFLAVKFPHLFEMEWWKAHIFQRTPLPPANSRNILPGSNPFEAFIATLMDDVADGVDENRLFRQMQQVINSIDLEDVHQVRALIFKYLTSQQTHLAQMLADVAMNYIRESSELDEESETVIWYYLTFNAYMMIVVDARIAEESV